MRGRGPGWEEGDLQAFIKIGSDNNNFYLYRAPAKSTSWEPEFTVDLETLRQLRARTSRTAGSAASRRPGQPNAAPRTRGRTSPVAGRIREHVADPGVNPPNLAAIQEVAAGIYRVAQNVTTPETELWVDDIRLADPVSRTGTAAAVDAKLTASDVGALAVSYIKQNGQFRQISQDPSYLGTDVLLMAGNLQLDRFLPTSLGLAVPVTIGYARTATDPELLTGTDIRGEALTGLRKPDNRSTTLTMAIRREQPGRNWLTRGLVDPLTAIGTWTKGHALTELSDVQSSTYAFNLSYQLQSRRRGIRIPLGGLVKVLPKFMREGDFGKSLGRADLSLAPTRVQLASGLSRDEANSTAFLYPASRPDDASLSPTQALTHLWRNAAGLTWQPLGMLNLNGDLTSTRDLRVYPDSNSLGRLAYAERRFLLGIPVGVERDRSVVTALALTPGLASWLRPRFISTSSFVLSRTLNSREPVQTDGDSGAFILPQTVNNARTNELGASIDFARGLRLLTGDSSFLGKAMARVRPIEREHPPDPHLRLRPERVRPRPGVSTRPRGARWFLGA